MAATQPTYLHPALAHHPTRMRVASADVGPLPVQSGGLKSSCSRPLSGVPRGRARRLQSLAYPATPPLRPLHRHCGPPLESEGNASVCVWLRAESGGLKSSQSRPFSSSP
eukprot:7036561-Alexandrium_andersonii.AAC.2